MFKFAYFAKTFLWYFHFVCNWVKWVFNHNLVLSEETLVGKHSAKTFLRFRHIPGKVLAHSSLWTLSKCFRSFCCLLAQTPQLLPLRSGDRLGHFLTLICSFFSHFSGSMFWVGAMLEDPSMTNLQCFVRGKEVLIQDFMVYGPAHWSLNDLKPSCTLSRKTAPKHNVSASVLHCRDGDIWVILSISL